jgi:hypothetical protein
LSLLSRFNALDQPDTQEAGILSDSWDEEAEEDDEAEEDEEGEWWEENQQDEDEEVEDEAEEDDEQNEKQDDVEDAEGGEDGGGEYVGDLEDWDPQDTHQDHFVSLPGSQM